MAKNVFTWPLKRVLDGYFHLFIKFGLTIIIVVFDCVLMTFQSPNKEASENQSQEEILLSGNNDHRLHVCVSYCLTIRYM